MITRDARLLVLLPVALSLSLQPSLSRAREPVQSLAAEATETRAAEGTRQRRARRALETHLRRADDRHSARERSRSGPLERQAAFRVDADAPVPRPGELVAASGSVSRLLRLVPKNRKGRVADFPIQESFVSRGVSHDAASGLVAIAAVSKVILYDPATEVSTVVEQLGDGESLAFANDVLFDDDGKLVIADMGEITDAKLPADGRLWEYDPLTGESRELGGKRRLRNPSLLAKDSAGRVFYVDAGSSRRIVPFLEPRWDAVFRLRGARRKGAKKVYRREGIQATAFDIGPDDRLWFGNVTEIVILEDKDLVSPCPVLPRPFEFVTGLAVVSETEAHAMDGSDVTGSRRTLQDVDDQCDSRVRLKGRKLDGGRGLAAVEAVEEEASE